MASIKTIFTNIANAIREKKGTSAKYLPENMAQEISTIETGITPSGKIEITNTEEINVTNYATAQVVDSNLSAENIKEGVSILGKVGTFKGGGDTTQEDRLITRTLTSYSNDRITEVGSYAFAYCENLTSVSLPNATRIDFYAFYHCSYLGSVSFPNATRIDSYAFAKCSNLPSVNFPKVTYINNNAFYQCSNLESANFPLVTSMSNYAFSYSPNLKSVNLPKVEYINNNAFYNCYSLIKLVITQTTKVCTLINTNVFDSCYHFLGTVNSTYNPEGLKDGRIYVPDELVDSYKSATNWSAYADIIVPLSTLVE